MDKPKEFDENQCPICLTGPQSNKSRPPCGHVFCYDCLVKWCNEKPICPVCKQTFNQFTHSLDQVYNVVILKTPVVISPELPQLSRMDRTALIRPFWGFVNETVVLSSDLLAFLMNIEM